MDDRRHKLKLAKMFFEDVRLGRKWLSGQYKVWHLEYFNRKEREKWHRIQ